MKKPDRAIRWAIVGVGKQAERIANSMKNVNGGTLVAAASSDPGRARRYADAFGIEHAGSLKEVLALETIDALFVSSPNHRHYEEVRHALNAGKHVLCEKPLTLSSAEAKRLVTLAEKKKLALGVNFHLRASPLFRGAKEIIASGKLGAVTSAHYEWSIGTPGEKQLPPLPAHMRWREHLQESGGGALMARAVHLFDLACFLLDQPIDRIKAMQRPLKTSATDTTLKGVFRQGPVISSFASSREAPFCDNYVYIQGTNGALMLREPFNDKTEGALEIRGTNTAPCAYPRSDLYAAALEDFQRHISGVALFTATGADGAHIVRVTETLRRSLSR